MRRVVISLVVTATAALALGACGSSSKNSSSNYGPSATNPPPTNAPATSAPAGAAASTASHSSVELEADDFYYTPTAITLKAGTNVTLEVKDDGSVNHNLTVPGLKVDQDLSPGKTVTVSLSALKPGTYPFHCEYHPDKMKGTITVG